MKKEHQKIEKYNNQFIEDIVKEVKQDFANRQNKRKALERQWQLNMNFLMGNQYCSISDKLEIEDYAKQYFWQEREVYNHISTIVESRLSKLAKIMPNLKVYPATNEEKDITCAKTSKSIIDSVSHNLNLEKLVRQANMWSEVCGTSFYKIAWNSQKGKIVGYDEDSKPIYEGDVEIAVCPPYEIYPAVSSIENLDDQPSIIHAKVLTIDEIEKIWGVKVDEEDVNVFTLSASSTIGGLGYTASIQKMIGEKAEKSAVVIERYEAPTQDLPNGRVTIVAGDKLLYIGELPYVNRVGKNKGYPFVKQCSLLLPASFWGASVIERMIPVQRAYNAVKNRKHEFLNRLSLGVLAVEDGSVDTENLEQEGLAPGKILVYREGSKMPEFLTSEEIPDAFDKEELNLLNEFTSISGVNTVNYDTMSSFATISGTALELLSDMENDKLIALVGEINNAVINIGKQILMLYKQFATGKRLSKLIGKNGEVETFYWSKFDIVGDDIVIDTEKELHNSVAKKQDMILTLLDKGVFQDENGNLTESKKSKILQMLDFGGWENVVDLHDINKSRAGRENVDLLNDIEIEVLEIDSHDVHVNEHTAFMLSNNFDLSNKKLKDKMLEHIKKHKSFYKN